jgi:hypothetical protein
LIDVFGNTRRNTGSSLYAAVALVASFFPARPPVSQSCARGLVLQRACGVAGEVMLPSTALQVCSALVLLAGLSVANAQVSCHHHLVRSVTAAHGTLV